ncbi:glycosyltransferase family 4 protein [Aquabacterium sp.]|uniref:glycosyltransferase family 4 protein n=1 Tax=Aquabacterium sp. TaxID=1872578 RepID=UPI002C2725CA|nr:glycosyltransferase family 4 protein [Aquabacterium sp.]HSW08978.1 glycosyltransferase family 4 protein [Aquabacterium sp.]
MGFTSLRIGLVGPLPPPAGGMANQTRQLAELLRADGAAVSVVQSNAPYRPAWAAQLPGVRALFRLIPFLVALWRAAGRSDVFHVMANSGWAWHLFAAPAIWIAALRRVPVVVNYRGGEAGAFLARSQKLVRWTMRRAARLVVPSGFLEQVFGSHGMASQVLPNIVDLARFRPGQRPAGDAPRLLVARNLEALYDNETAIRALVIVRERHPAATLTLAGSGPEEARLRRLAEELGLAAGVRFAGRLNPDQMAEAYRDSDIALNPSLADNMPNSLLESMASGVPVVSTDVGGVPFMVRHESTALLVPVRDPAAMAAAVIRLLADDALRQRLARAGLDEVQRYTWSRVAPLLSEIYRSAMA